MALRKRLINRGYNIATEIGSSLISNTVDVLRIAERTREKVIVNLESLAGDLEGQLQQSGLSAEKQARLNSLLNKAANSIGTAYRTNDNILKNDLQELATFQGEFIPSMMNNVLQADLISAPFTHKDLVALANDTMIQGLPQKDWWTKQSGEMRTRFQSQMRIGLAAGETNDQLVSRIRGTKTGRTRELTAEDGRKVKVPETRGGIMDVSRRDATTLVRTSALTVNNSVLNETYDENKDVLNGKQWLSTLDTRTSPICRARDKMAWDFDGKPLDKNTNIDFPGPPPAHFNCRSVLIPVLKSWEELSGIKGLPETPDSTRASMDGQVAADKNYEDWLKDQPEDVQRDVLGDGRYELWQKGTKLNEMVDQSGRSLSVAELQQKVEQGSLGGAAPGKGSWKGYGGAELSRFMGQQGLDFKQAKSVFEKLGVTPADNTVRIQLKAGRDGTGKIPGLSAEEAAELQALIDEARGVKPPKPDSKGLIEPPEKAADWVRRWVLGETGMDPDINYTKLVKQIQSDPELLDQLKEFRPDKPVTLYRAGLVGEDHELQSWTYTKAFAESIVEIDETGKRVLLTRTFKPSEILADLTRIKDPTEQITVHSQREVIVRVPKTGPVVPPKTEPKPAAVGTGKDVRKQVEAVLQPKLDRIKHLEAETKRLGEEAVKASQRDHESDPAKGMSSAKWMKDHNLGEGPMPDSAWRAYMEEKDNVRRAAGWKPKLEGILEEQNKAIQEAGDLRKGMTQAIHEQITLPEGQRLAVKLDYTGSSAKMKQWARESSEFVSKVTSNKYGAAMNVEVVPLPAKNPDPKKRQNSYSIGDRIFMLPGDGKEIYSHEWAHVLEYQNPGAATKAQEFLKSRAGNEELKRLKDITGSNYNDWEVAWEDKFIEKYMGKVYNQDIVNNHGRYVGIKGLAESVDKFYGTEITSMGIELLHKDPMRLLREDPEMFETVIDILRGHL